MPEPAANDIDLDAGLKEMDSRGVAEDVRRNVTASGACIDLEPSDVAANDLVDAEARQGTPRVPDEHRLVGACDRAAVVDEESQLARGLLPEWAGPPLVALAVQVDARRGPELNVGRAEVGNLLDARTGIVEEEQQGAIAGGMSAARGHAREEGTHLLPLQEARLGRRHALKRDRRHPFRLGE